MKKPTLQILSLCMLVMIVSGVMHGCTEEPELWKPRSTDQIITQYVESNDNYSEFADLIEVTGLKSLLSVRGPFTLFLPDNDAVRAYYASKNIHSHHDLSADFKYDLVMNHLIPLQIESGDIGLGAIREVNGIGDYLVTEFEGADIIVNKGSKVIRRDIRTANGVVHVINKVIEPVTKSVFELLEDMPGLSLFTEGLRLTGLKDTLNMIEFPFGQRMARARFTILAVADTTFNRFGIHTINDLINYYTDSPDSITHLNNGFYRYMEYHCMAETHYMNNFDNRLYPILSYDNNISVTVDSEDYKLNYSTTTREYTGFYIEHSNYPAKNGAIHTVNDLFPVFEPRPTTIIWETTDHFDLKQGDYYGKHYMRWHDGQNTFKNIKWEGDYLLYYFKTQHSIGLMNYDCLSMSGWFWLEVTTPKIMKGNYRLTSHVHSGVNFTVYVDGVSTAFIRSSDPTEVTRWGDFEWTETTEHTIRVVARTPGLFFWDYLIFTPLF